MSNKPDFSLQGKTALVTGANKGIGLAIARAFASAGARVAICGRDTLRNEEAIMSLRRIEPQCHGFAMDLEKTDEISRFYETVTEEMGCIDILVNNAAIQFRGRADTIAVADFERVLRINLTAPYVLSQCFARDKIEAKTTGSIIMIASLMSEAARPTTSPYTAAKGGIRQLVRALAVDWAPFGIRVNGIGPGYVATEMNKDLLNNEEFSEWVVKRTPLGRWAVPEDYEGAAVFLSSPAASFITGQILYVDGGWLATF